MKRITGYLMVIVVALVCGISTTSLCQEPEQAAVISDPGIDVKTFKPSYAPPSEILDFLGVTGTGSWNMVEWQERDGWHSVEVRVNAPANLFVLTGSRPDVEHVLQLIKQADTPPRQIEIEVKIVEVRKSAIRDLGIDWDEFLQHSSVQWSYNHDIHREWGVTQARVNGSPVSEVVRMLDESGAGSIRTAPKVLTVNNKRATILDGTRVTYITRYSAYNNYYETDSMDAGLALSVVPSIMEDGYITLQVTAELTSLLPAQYWYDDSPVKEGQMIDNTVIVRDGESVLLGGRTRVVEEKRKKRFPILGHILPFIFSREITTSEEVESFVVITPRVVDFNTAINMGLREIIEGQ